MPDEPAQPEQTDSVPHWFRITQATLLIIMLCAVIFFRIEGWYTSKTVILDCSGTGAYEKLTAAGFSNESIKKVFQTINLTTFGRNLSVTP